MSTPAPKLPGDEKVEPLVIVLAVLALIAFVLLSSYDAAHPIR